MEQDEFIHLVHERLGGSRDIAERVVRSTLETLGQRLPSAEAEDLAAQLPPPLATYLQQTAQQDEEFPVEEFYERVAELGDLLPEDAEDQAKAVLTVLNDAVSAGQISDLLAALPADYGDLLAETGPG